MTRHIFPIEDLYSYSEIAADMTDLIRLTKANREEIILGIVDRFHKLHFQEPRLTFEVIAGELIRWRLFPNDTLNFEDTCHVVDGFAELITNALWPNLQSLGYCDTKVPVLKGIRLIGYDAILIDVDPLTLEYARGFITQDIHHCPQYGTVDEDFLSTPSAFTSASFKLW